MLKSVYEWFGLEDFIKFKTFKKLAIVIASEYALFAMIMLAI